MPSQNQSPQPNPMSMTDRVNLTALLGKLLATLTTPLLRIDQGVDEPGYIGLATLTVIFVWAEYTRDTAVVLFGQLWFAGLVINRGWSLWRSRTVVIHSNDPGRSWLVMLIPFVKSDEHAKLLEPVLVFGLGYWLDSGLGMLLVASSGGLLLTEMMSRMVMARQRILLGNAESEMRAAMGSRRR